MSTTEDGSSDASGAANVKNVDLKFEVVVIPVSDAAHGEHKKRIGAADANWPDWCADYMVREQAGAELPS